MLVTLRFVRVLEPGVEDSGPEEDEQVVRPDFWRLEHKLRDWRRCWCDQEAGAAVMRGLLLPWYVIEVEVGVQKEVRYTAEDGGTYVRGHGSTELVGATCGRCGREGHLGRDCDSKNGD